MGWSYDINGIIILNFNWIKSEIFECKLWNKQQVDKLINRFLKVAKSKSKYSKFCANMINRVFLISLWYNNNIYLNKRFR